MESVKLVMGHHPHNVLNAQLLTFCWGRLVWIHAQLSAIMQKVDIAELVTIDVKLVPEV